MSASLTLGARAAASEWGGGALDRKTRIALLSISMRETDTLSQQHKIAMSLSTWHELLFDLDECSRLPVHGRRPGPRADENMCNVYCVINVSGHSHADIQQRRGDGEAH